MELPLDFRLTPIRSETSIDSAWRAGKIAGKLLVESGLLQEIRRHFRHWPPPAVHLIIQLLHGAVAELARKLRKSLA